MQAVARSHTGLVRLTNEDCFYVDADCGLAILADGMGGLFAGEEASAVAVEAVRRRIVDERRLVNSCADAEQVLREAHDVLIEYAQTQSYAGKMGTTLLFWINARPRSFFAHIGDSRLYQLADGALTQLSKDHSVAQRMVDMGTLAKSQVYLAPERHILTQGLGLPGFINPQVAELSNQGRLLLCSDGLSDCVPQERIRQVLTTEDDAEVAATELVGLALDEGGKDNITLIIVDP